MGQVWGGLLNTFEFLISDEVVSKIMDRVFDNLAATDSSKHGAEKNLAGNIQPKSKKKTLNYSQLHEAIAAVFEEINGTIPGANWVPPSQDLLNKMLEESDKGQYREIDREKFGELVRKYSAHLAATYRRNVLISAVAVPAVATLTKQVIVTVGTLLAKVPNSVFFATLGLASVIIVSRSYNKTASQPNVISNR